MRKLFVTLVAVVAMLAAAAPVSAGGPKLVVDDDGAQCSDAGFTTIQAAVDAATPGSKIKVCAGTHFGAVITKPVRLKAKGPLGAVVIDNGPYTHAPYLRAGFFFPDATGNGSKIEGFHFAGAQQTTFATDDGRIDFPIFSRGAGDVTVRRNLLTDSLQGISAWNGSGWEIKDNTITDLWTICGGGIGIILGGFGGGTYTDHEVEHNTVTGTVHVSPSDCGGYDASGIVIYADFRWGGLGGSGDDRQRDRQELG